MFSCDYCEYCPDNNKTKTVIIRNGLKLKFFSKHFSFSQPMNLLNFLLINNDYTFKPIALFLCYSIVTLAGTGGHGKLVTVVMRFGD